MAITGNNAAQIDGLRVVLEVGIGEGDDLSTRARQRAGGQRAGQDQVRGAHFRRIRRAAWNLDAAAIILGGMARQQRSARNGL